MEGRMNGQARKKETEKAKKASLKSTGKRIGMKRRQEKMKEKENM